jgi:dihydropteroate synthase
MLQTRPDSPARVMGILNVTPDSFSDGGRYLQADQAAARAREMLDHGAEILDVGAESTRPGAERIDPAEQIRRLDGILQPVVETGAPVSIDTTRVEVAQWALQAGACLLNDVSAGRDEPEMLDLAGQRGVPIVLMHMLGQPADMQNDPQYENVLEDVATFLAGRVEAAVAAGVPARHCILDPGIGFGKTLGDNLRLLGRMDRFVQTGLPVLLGPSRKRFIADLAGPVEPEQRVGGTIAACLAARAAGVRWFRVHDVGPVCQALRVAEAIAAGPEKP